MAEPVQAPISVVVPTRGRASKLRDCLAAIAASLGPGDELVVVESGSADPAVAAAAAEHGGRHLRTAVKGASRARNQGWQAARNELVAFIDDDVRVAPGWADGLRQAFVMHPEVGFITGRVEVPPDQDAERPVALKDETEPHTLDAAYVGTPGHSANMGVRREALRLVGGFDERMGPGGDFPATEDNDLLDRLYAAGVVGRYEPGAQAWHDQWRRRRDLLALDWAYGLGMGARAAKLLRTDRARARIAFDELFWSWGLKDTYHFLKLRRRFVAASSLVRVVGGVAGVARTLPVAVSDGHFVPRRSLRERVARARVLAQARHARR